MTLSNGVNAVVKFNTASARAKCLKAANANGLRVNGVRVSVREDRSRRQQSEKTAREERGRANKATTDNDSRATVADKDTGRKAFDASTKDPVASAVRCMTLCLILGLTR